MKLTKKYRIWWNQDLDIQNNYIYDYEESVTYCGNKEFTYFESDKFNDIIAKIKTGNLKINKL